MLSWSKEASESFPCRVQPVEATISAVPANLANLSFPVVFFLQRPHDRGQLFRRARLQKRVHIPPGRFFARPAVHPLRATIPIGNFSRGIRNDNCVVRQVEQFGVPQQLPSHILQIALRPRFLNHAPDRGHEPREVLLQDKIRRAGTQRFADLVGVIRPADEDEGHTGHLFPRDSEGAQTVIGGPGTIGQNDVDWALREFARQFRQAAGANQLALDRAIPQLRADELGVGVIGFEMNNLQ